MFLISSELEVSGILYTWLWHEKQQICESRFVQVAERRQKWAKSRFGFSAIIQDRFNFFFFK